MSQIGASYNKVCTKQSTSGKPEAWWKCRASHGRRAVVDGQIATWKGREDSKLAFDISELFIRS
jgi:hypothetical protein